MDFLIENWPLLVALVAVIATAAYSFYNFIKLPRDKQLSKVEEWLLWAVTEAEKQFGGGTGQLKLRYVYDMFVSRFPTVAKLISFDFFSIMVDNALEKMRKLLETNNKIESYVENKQS